MDQALVGLPRIDDPNVLVGFDTADDAGVYRLTDECALVQTLDFVTPIVDDPYTFGAIAAANSLSDVYAMGGRPVTALSILCYPGKGDMDDLRAILQGGAEKIREAGCALVGGHSVSEDEIKFGYSVTGVVHPSRVLANSGALAGDVLVLTKPIGTGVISTALKRGIAAPEHVEGSTASMLRLNRVPDVDAHGCTDITGFGLLGHAREMAAGSNVTIEIEAGALRFLPGAVEYAAAGAQPAGLRNNREFVSPCVNITRAIAPEIEALLYDPQTSGGLLLSLTPSSADAFLTAFPPAFVVGRVLPREDPPIRVI